MAEILVRLTESERLAFQTKVGKGNMTKSIRNYIKNMVSSLDGYDQENIKRKEFFEVKAEKERIDDKFAVIQSEIQAIEQKKKEQEQAELEAYEKEKKKMADVKHDTMKANLARMV
jgi:hypothetical protein